MDRQSQEGHHGKRILVAVAAASLLTIAATGCRGLADDAARAADESGSGGAPELPLDPAKDGVEAACRLKDSSEVNTYTDEARGNTAVGEFCNWAG